MDYIKIMKTLKEEYDRNHCPEFVVCGSNKMYEKGDAMPKSYAWDIEHDIQSNKKLNGTLGIEILAEFNYDDYMDDIDKLKEAIEYAKNNYPYKHWYIAMGDIDDYGYEEKTLIIEDAKVVVLI